VLYREDPNKVDFQQARWFPTWLRERFQAGAEGQTGVAEAGGLGSGRDPTRSRPAHAHGLFLKSVKDRSPSVEDAEPGHNAATAAHLPNRAFRHRCVAGLDAAARRLTAV